MPPPFLPLLLITAAILTNATVASAESDSRQADPELAGSKPEGGPPNIIDSEQPLSPEAEMAIMRAMNLENRIQTLQTVPERTTTSELAGHFSGTWICFTTMRLNGQLGRGIMEIRLEQEGNELVGEGGQLKHPFDPPETIRPIGTRSASVSDYVGQFKPARHNMVVIERRRVDGPTWATFTAVMAGDGRTARGTLVNGGGNYGLMFMVRREFLSDFQHLLTEEGRQAEAASRLIGIEKLEAALDTASMDTARIEWWRTDKNKDGKLQYSEFPHPDWKRANRNGDNVVDWAEEVSDRVLRKLARDGDFLAKHGNDAQKQWPSIYAWGVAHPGFEPIFHFVDWDRDGKITPAEYTAFEKQLNAYNDPSFPKTNQKGQTREDLQSKTGPKNKLKGVTKAKPKADPHTLKMEAAFSKEKLTKAGEMWAALDKNRDNIWQYDEFPHPDWKRANRDGDDGLSWKEELADQMFRSQSRSYPKAHVSASQKSWDSLEAWIKDRPDYGSLFPFIDWDNDGKITEAEYEVFDVQIKSYMDGSYAKTNEQGETGMQVFKRLAADAPKRPAPKTALSLKTSWDSQEEWNRDKPTMKWIFPFIDKNSDGKIDSDEYQAIQEYKKEHKDWQNQARKELGLTAPVTKSFTIAVLPDTQFYCDTRLKLSAKWGNGDLRRYFFAQTEWVRDNQERLNIAFLAHEGDLVQADAPEEWVIARDAMSILDGKVPYIMCLGNHDMGFEKVDNKYGGNIGVNRTTHFNTYFPREKFAKRREFGGTFDPERHDNSWYHFEASGMKFLIVSLECKPRDEVLEWANEVVSEHPDHRVIVLTHAYLNPKKSRNTSGGVKAKGNTGEQTWQKFVSKHENIFMVLCGHHTGEAVRTDTGDHGNQVHQILCDYQGMNNGGESWLRYMTFKPDANKISIYTYNPALDQYMDRPSSRFDLDYPMTVLPKVRAANPLDKINPVKALADRVRAHVNSQPLRFPNQHWVRGAYYAGLMGMYESTSDRAYLDDCMEWGKQISWGIKEQGGGPYESGAYPLVCGQIWYGCYQAEKDEMMMQPTLVFLEDPKVENPVSAPGKWYLENTGHRFVDGLFTAPPTLAMLYQMTGDEKYANWMDACFWDVHGEIFDHDAGLFYRDARSIPRKTKNGKKVLWSRGNGWAFGGVTRILKYLPEHHASYARYEALYVQMAESLALRQQDDGFWRTNLDDSEQHKDWESSGTGFFTYGIAWGINNGILDRDRFLPVVKKGWAALTLVVDEDGQVGWSQPAGGGPGKVAEADTSKFGTGIFLLAASEMYQLELGAANDVNRAAEQFPTGKEKQDKESAPMANNAWGNLYAFHQSRAHYRDGKTYLAWVGPDNHPYVSVYSHKGNEWSSHERVGTNLISPKDYHGNPSILIDREGFLHVFYGGHNKKMRYSRSSKPLSNNDWEDYTSRLPYTESTYPQLFTMSDGTIYSFYRRRTHRGNWSYVTSKDNGSTWSEEVHVLDGHSPPGNGWYAAFAKESNRDQIHLMFLWHASKDHLPHSRRNLYYMKMDHSSGTWTSMENEKLTAPLSFGEANGKVMIFDSKNKYSSIPQHWLTVDGRPVGLNRISDSDGVETRHLHVWTGETWRTQKVPIDVLLKPAKNEWVGFRSREGTVQRFTSTDDGAHWTPGEVVLKTDGEQKLNALFANAHPDAVLAITDEVDARRVPGKQRLWVWGDAGFLK